MSEEEIINHLAITNKPGYNFDKLSEELAELHEKIIKKKMKEGSSKEPTKDSIIEEIGDVMIRLCVVCKQLEIKSEEVKARVEYKLNKYKGYIKEGKYVGRI